MDADMATPLKHIKEFYDLYLQNNEVIIATRDFLRYRHNPFRIAVSRLGNIIFQLAGGVWVEDSQCGFKMFSARAARICFGHLTITGWGFDMEILTAARANKFPITSVRIHDWEAIPEGVFEDNVIANTARSFVDLGLIFTRRMRGYYRS
jgi:dolichyl-phosphate beta-glucosyltransferase